MNKIILKIVAVVLVIAGWFFLIQIETPCEANQYADSIRQEKK